MKKFLNDNFMLKNDVAVRLYNDFAKDAPIIDYHCHIEARDIAEDKHFKNITELWLGGDHYKWRLMRAAGIEEKYITGDASDKEKFIKWIEVLQSAIGNPLYHWSHLELKNYFDFDSYVKKDSAEMLWEYLNNEIKEKNMSARSIIDSSNVALLCTTDDPADDLNYHEIINRDASFKTVVIPAFRPDNAMLIEKNEYLDYLEKLGNKCQKKISSFEDLKDVLSERMKYFASHGCRISDHGLTRMEYEPFAPNEIETIFKKRLNGIIPDEKECSKFKTAFLLFVHREYQKLDWTSQLHYGCLRDNNSKMFEEIGANTGFDAINTTSGTENLGLFFDALSKEDSLPRVIVYSLNPNDNSAIDTIIACFNDSSAVCKIQHGSAWWFNDSKKGMEAHLEALASDSFLSGFVGMLTDSRSFVSYARHDYFRRILCNYIGSLIEQNEFPDDDEIVGEIIENICFKNALLYFGF